jgi:hypothetical protein
MITEENSFLGIAWFSVRLRIHSFGIAFYSQQQVKVEGGFERGGCATHFTTSMENEFSKANLAPFHSDGCMNCVKDCPASQLVLE